jgi:hypothetical protein
VNVSLDELAKELDVLIRARVPLVIVQTIEEGRAQQAMAVAARQSGRSLVTWNAADGFFPATAFANSRPDVRDTVSALSAIGSHEGKTLFVVNDVAELWNDVRVRRALKSAAIRSRAAQSSIVVLTHLTTIPIDLSDMSVVMTLKFPTIEDLSSALAVLESVPKLKNHLTAEGRGRLVEAAVGLTQMQAETAFGRAIVGDGVLNDEDVDLVRDAKRQLIQASRALEFIDLPDQPIETGGLHALKHWLETRRGGFTAAARDFGLAPPKGLALIGIPGTGKSLSARYIAQAWSLPLLRLDLGSVFGSLVGESEERIRDALRRAEAVAPCVLWLDELEKGISSGGLDGGTSSRVFGTLLTWMQEKKAPVVVVATANDVSRLPPELLRRGRFDEVFFLDLPSEAERRQILAIQLGLRGRSADAFDLTLISHSTAGFVGAELEQVVIDAMYEAFAEGVALQASHLQRSVEQTVPLSRSQVEVVRSLRNWLLDGRARSASYEDVREATSQFVELEINA